MIALATLASTAAHAGNYGSLWKKAEQAKAKDLPATRAELLGKIARKAFVDKEWGHLLKAETELAEAKAGISPDSLPQQVDRLIATMHTIGKSSPEAAAIYACVIGRICSENKLLPAERRDSAAFYTAKAMADPAMLAKAKAEDYQPATAKGHYGKYFNNDLLHAIGFETKCFKAMHTYYSGAGNRYAACLCAIMRLRHKADRTPTAEDTESRIAALDSITHEYGDLEVAGEAAIDRYEAMEGTPEYDAEDKMRYLDYAMGAWGAWPRMNVLRNAKRQLTLPSYGIHIPRELWVANREDSIIARQITNIGSLSISIKRLSATGKEQLSTDGEKAVEKLLKRVDLSFKPITATRKYAGIPDYKTISDTIAIPGLPPGVYLVEAAADDGVRKSHSLLHVSGLEAMCQNMPGGKARIVVVDAADGQPVEGAKVEVYSRPVQWRDTGRLIGSLQTDSVGEAILAHGEQSVLEIMIGSDGDEAHPPITLPAYGRAYPNTGLHRRVSLFTDRKVYRPGQEVMATAIAYTNENHTTTKAAVGDSITLELRDANNQVVEKTTAATDSFGTATARFTLPQRGLTGQFSVGTPKGERTYFSVEQYKRPSFSIVTEPLGRPYSAGDTITISGRAVSYAGAPVAGAQVAYAVEKSEASRTQYYGKAETIKADTTETDSQGIFRIPIHLAAKRPKALFKISIQATGMGGETIETCETFPTDEKPARIAADWPLQAEQRTTDNITFSYTNTRGEALDGDITWAVDNGKGKECPAGTPIEIRFSDYSIGKHVLRAECRGTVLEKTFIVFNLDSVTAPGAVDDWFHCSAKEFPTDGSAARVQFGGGSPNQHIVYTVNTADSVIEKGFLELDGTVATMDFAYKPCYGEGLSFSCSWVKGGKVFSHTVSIGKPLPDKKLKTEWMSFRNRLTPGRAEEWTLRITNPDGTPAKAQLMAVVYDKALDAIRTHSWDFSPHIYSTPPYTPWTAKRLYGTHLYGEQTYKSLPEPALSVWGICMPQIRTAPMAVRVGYAKERTRANLAAAPTADMAAMQAAVEESAPARNNGVNGGESSNKAGQIPSRENFTETATFQPRLETDSSGVVAIGFTLPESVTTWRFMGLAHDRDMDFGRITGEAVAQKNIMVQPNMPRFLREGDKGEIAATISNLTAKAVRGKATMEISDPETGKTIMRKTAVYEAGPMGSAEVSFPFSAEGLPQPSVCTITAEGGGHTDGEQHYIAVMPQLAQGMNTAALTMAGAGAVEVDLDSLFPTGCQDGRVTVEYTASPVWLAIKALPYAASPAHPTAINAAAALYANCIGGKILGSSAEFGKAVEEWRAEEQAAGRPAVNLEENGDLKTMLLDETPWVAEAIDEAGRQARLCNFFDRRALEQNTAECTRILAGLQNQDGALSWIKGMPGNTYATSFVYETLSRLIKSSALPANAYSVWEAAGKYLGRKAAEEVEEMRKARKSGRAASPSSVAASYAYSCAVSGRSLGESGGKAVEFIADALAGGSPGLSIYGKAVAAIVKAWAGDSAAARVLLQSVMEHSVQKSGMGRYFDTGKAAYSWANYRIPTQVAAIEALREIAPADKAAEGEMLLWLMQAKRTQDWGGGIDCVNAVQALATGGASPAAQVQTPQISMGGRPLPTGQGTARVGYVKVSAERDGAQSVEIKKDGGGVSWGAVYAQFLQNENVQADKGEGFSIRREIIGPDGKAVRKLKVGDKVRVRITVEADRDYDFVQISDRRAACMEPASQLSGYRRGHYTAPQDNATLYFFDKMPKGKHTMETTYHIDRSGDYLTGVCTVQCAYSPEFHARARAAEVSVE